MARSQLADADGATIDHLWNAEAIRNLIVDEAEVEIPEIEFSTVSALGAAESDGIAAKCRSALGFAEWADLAHACSHDPRVIPTGRWHALIQAARAHAANEGAREATVVAGWVAETAERLSRHTSEQSIVEQVANVENAALKHEHDKTDLETDDDRDVQVYTGTSSTSWWQKAWGCRKSEAYSRDEKPFDVFVFAYPNDDGTLTIGVRDVHDKNASPAYSNTPA
jgi:hypothetical protein